MVHNYLVTVRRKGDEAVTGEGGETEVYRLTQTFDSIGACPAPLRRATTVYWRVIPPACGLQNTALAVTKTLPIAEAVHRALVALAGRGQTIDCPELTGQDRFCQPLSDGHQHAKILPLDTDGDSIIDHVLLHAPMGLGPLALQAVQDLTTLNLPEQATVRMELIAADQPVKSLDTRLFLPTHGARVWYSLTPYVPPRYLKRSGNNSLLGQVHAELASRGFPPVVNCQQVPELSQQFLHFVRSRRAGKLPPPQNYAVGLRLEFKEQIHGPLAIGYASHFGLGWFRADDCA